MSREVSQKVLKSPGKSRNLKFTFPFLTSQDLLGLSKLTLTPLPLTDSSLEKFMEVLMKKFSAVVLYLIFGVACSSASGARMDPAANDNPEKGKTMKAVYDFEVKDIDGKDVKLGDYRGKVALVVNVASRCGYTPQYEGLQALYTKYKDRGFVILGFPANNFG